MITLLASLAGFASSVVPEIIRLFHDKADKKHELALFSMQLAFQKELAGQRLEMMGQQADVAESVALYQTYRSGVRWVDAYNGTVRPTITYAFFVLYASVKLLSFASLGMHAPLSFYLDILWNGEDQAIFAGIISFYFGQRAMNKMRRK